MEVLNAASLTPVSVLSDRRAEPKKNLSLPSISLPNFSKPTALNSSSSSSKFSEVLSRSFNGGLVALSSIFSGGFAKALTYEEALELSNTTATSVGNDSDFVDNAIKIVTENPAIVIGGFAILGLPLVLSQFFNKKPKSFGVESAKNAYSKLGEDGNAQLLDIRGLKDIREVGSPDLRGLKKKTVSIAYKGEDKPGFLKKLALKFKDPENTTLFILDKFDGSSELVAELVTVNGFKAAYAIKDGAEGPRGWTNSGLPWIEPKKTFSFDFSGLTDTLGETSGALSVTLGLAAATGLGLLAFTEVETILQLLGSAALVQLVSKKLLFAEDRKQTLQLVDEFLTTKVAPKELVGEIKEIGLALLPSTVNKKALPAPTKETPDTGGAADNVLKSEKTPELTPEPAVEAAAEPPALVNTTPLAEVKEESFPTLSRPLSPYAQYPDFKPPTSPCPSQP